MPGNVQSIERAAGVLRILASGEGPRALGDLAELLGLSKSTTHGIVHTLTAVGFARQLPDGRYVLSGELAAMAPEPMDVNEMRARATGWVDALAAKTGMSARLVVLPHAPSSRIADAVIAHHVFGSERGEQHVEIGEHLPLTATAEGKVLLATDPRGRTVSESLTLEPSTHRTLVDRPALYAELEGVRRQGHAVDFEEFLPRTGGVAAPVRGRGDLVVAALGVRGPLPKVFQRGRTVNPALLQRLHEAVRGTARALVAERW